MAVALDILKKKTGFDDTMAQQAIDVKNREGIEAFKQFVTKNKPVQPTAPVTPPTPTPTGQTMQGVNGETFQVAPQNAQGLSTPAQPTQSPTPVKSEQDINKQYGGFIQDNGINSVQPLNVPTSMPAGTNEPVKAKTEAPIDYTQAKGREQDIMKNLESFKAQNMTPEQIMKASDYQNATPEKKALIEPYLKTTQPTASGMFNAIIARQDIPDEQKTSTAFKIAQNRYTKANLYASMTPAQVSQAMTDVKLIEGSQAWEDLKLMNPKLVKDVENLRVVNGSKPNIFTYSNNPDGTPVKTNNLETQFAEDYLGDYGEFLKSLFTVQSPEQIRSAIYTPDVQQAQEKATEIELRMNEIEKNIDSVDDDVDKEMAGSGATSSRIALEKASRKEKFQNQYNAELKNYTTYANKANNLITQNTAAYESSQTQKTAMNNALALAGGKIFENQMNIAQEDRAMQNSLALSQMQFDQKIAQQAQAMNDPTTAISTMIEEYKKLGVPFTRSTQQVISDFQSSGLDLPTYLSDLQKTIQSKPEYQKILANKAGELSDTEKLVLQSQLSEKSDIRNFQQQMEIARMNGDITRENYLWQIQNDPEKQAKALEMQEKLNANKSLFDVLGKNVGTYEGNRGYDLAGKLGDPLPAGGNWTVKSVDTAGELGVPYRAGTKKPYGNTVVMVDENGNEVRYSHLESIGVKPGDTLGFGDIVGTRGNTGNVKGASGETLTAEQLAKGRGAHLDIEIKDSTGKLLSQKEQIEWLKTKKVGGGENENTILAKNILGGVGSLTDLTPTIRQKVLPELNKLIEAGSTDDKNRNLILKSAISTKEVDATSLQKLKDMETVKFQMANIAENLKNQSTGPIIGRIKEFNPYDTEAQVALAQLAGLTPKVARGIFGEVGVLTDADLANYQKALPNLKSTDEKNKLILDFMNKLLAEGYRNSLTQEAKAGRNVANYLDDYDTVTRQINAGGKIESKPYSKYE